MASKQQITGMRGVYLVAAELSRLGFIASPTSRGAAGADILVTDQNCKRSYSVQVKTNVSRGNFWLLNKDAEKQVSESHIYVLVIIRKQKDDELLEYFIAPSKDIVRKIRYSKTKKGDWRLVYAEDIEKYRDNWKLFGEAQ